MAIFSGNSNELSPRLIKDRYEASTKAMRRERWEYILNRSFLSGDQWVYHDRPLDRLRSLPRDPGRVRATINRLWPASRHLMSKLLSRELLFEVPPSDTDDASIHGAHLAEAVLRDLHREHNWEEIREMLAWDAWLGGTSVLALDWDPRSGTTIDYLPNTGEAVGTGEIVETPLTILEVAWEPGSRNAEKAIWWIRAQALPAAEVQARYNLPKAPAADADVAEGFLGRQLLREERQETPVDLTLVMTYYERPNPQRPQGSIATVVGGKFVDGPKPWPFPFTDRLNMVVIRETKISGKSTGDTVFSAAVPIQTAYNASWSNIIEHLKNAGNARLMIPEGSVEGLDELSDLPGEMVLFNSAIGEPQWLSPANMEAWVLQQPEQLALQMDDILGLHEVSRGVAPTGIESGVGLSVLVEQDATPLGAMTRELARAFERYATMVLKTYSVKVKESRKARVKTVGMIPEVVQWTGKALSGQVVAEIPMDAIMPRSRAAMMAFAERMLTIGVLPADRPDVFAKMADIPDADNMMKGIDPAAHKAERENYLFSIGQVPVPKDFDTHATHIERHNIFRMSTRFESMPQEMQELIGLHIQGHETMAAEQMGTQYAKASINPALAAVPTADGAAPLPEGMVPAGAAGGPASAPGMEEEGGTEDQPGPETPTGQVPPL
jgi:hypothetical protein